MDTGLFNRPPVVDFHQYVKQGAISLHTLVKTPDDAIYRCDIVNANDTKGLMEQCPSNAMQTVCPFGTE